MLDKHPSHEYCEPCALPWIYACTVPSYRVIMTMGLLRPGAEPHTVLPRAADAARELAVVEATDLAVVAGGARLIVRFEAEEAELAVQIARQVADTTDLVAEVVGYTITQSVRGRWFAVG